MFGDTCENLMQNSKPKDQHHPLCEARSWEDREPCRCEEIRIEQVRYAAVEQLLKEFGCTIRKLWHKH